MPIIFTGRKGFVTSKLATPTLIFGTVTSTSIALSWTSVANAAIYVVERSTSIDFTLNLTTINNGSSLSLTDSGLTTATQYYYRVKARGAGYIDSAYYSNTISTSGGGTQLLTPSLSRLGIGTTSLSVTWPSVASATGYILERATNAGFTTGLTILYSGLAAGVIREFQPGYTLEYHDSGLTPGTTYYYRVKATASGFIDSNYSTQNWTTGSANRTHNYIGNIGDPGKVYKFDGGSSQWQIFDVPSNTTFNVYAGDTVALNNPSSGHWQYLSLEQVHGTPTQPITIRNQGQVTMQNGLSYASCSWINTTGSHSSKTLAQGLVIEQTGAGVCIEVWGFARHHIFDNIKCTLGGYAMRIKNEVATFQADPDCGLKYAWPSHIHDIEVHHMECIELSQDTFYVGSSGPWPGDRFIICNGNSISPRPCGLANINIHDCNINGAGRSAFQLGCLDMGVNKFHHNTITEIGFEYNDAQGAGFSIGGANNGDTIEIYNNNISRTYREGMYSYHFGTLSYHDNTHNDIGPVSIKTYRGLLYMQINLNAGQTVSSVWNPSSPGKVIATPEYFFEWFFNPAGNPQMRVQRRDNNYSATEMTIPSAFPTTMNVIVTLPYYSYAVGQKVKVQRDENNWFKGTVTSYDSVNRIMVMSVTSSAGSGNTFLSWQVYKENQTVFEAVEAISTIPIGTHAGTQLDPYDGFGASSTILQSQVVFMTETWIPAGFAIGNLMLNPFNSKPVDIYGTPAGLLRFNIQNNTFGTQKAASTKVVSFVNSTNNYGTGNILCGNTYLGSPLTESNITKPGGSIVTYTLSNSCIPTGSLVQQNDTFAVQFGASSPGGLTWLPDDYSAPANSSRTHPLIIFLHGAGEGSETRNNALLLSTSLPEIISTGGWNGIAKNPNTNIYSKFIVCAPQAPGWSYSDANLSAILDDIQARYRIDPTRIYITGLSAGGSGCVSVSSVANLRTKTTAIVPIAAAGFNNTPQDTAFDPLGGTYNVKFLTIYGELDSGFRPFCEAILSRYNAYTPAPSVAGKGRMILGGGHNEATWNTCFATNFDVNNGVGTAMNVYEWMLQYNK
jgi:predicted esterase